MACWRRILSASPLWVLGVCLLLAVWAAAASESPPEEASAFKVVSPADQAALLSGSFDVIVKADRPELADRLTLELGRQEVAWDKAYGGPVRVARLRLAPGVYELKVGDRVVRFGVALNEQEHDGPPQWPVVRSHTMEPDPDRCAACHENSSDTGQIRIGALRSYKACFGCHRSVEFELRHAHPLQPLENCQTCHALHGSSRKALLKAPVKQLCADCHDT